MGAPLGNQFAKGHGKGRPQAYTDQMIEKEAQAFREWMAKEDSIFIKSFAVERGYSPQRLTEFAEKNNVFSEVLELAKSWQECRLINYGLFNKTNSGLTKFVLANHHNYSEKTQVTGDAANPLSFLLSKVDGNSKGLISDQDQSE